MSVERASADLPSSRRGEDEIRLTSQELSRGRYRTTLSVPGMHCGGCISKVEKALNALPGVSSARVNLSARRATVDWAGDPTPPLVEALSNIGFDAHVLADTSERTDPSARRLVRATAVAGFAAANIMLFSVGVWAGAEGAWKDAFHWLSAAIALPTLFYSGRVFFEPALAAIRRGRSNMDVPISVGVLLAFGLSLFETITHGEHAYFDATVTLLFFLLIGRTIDHTMRSKARSAVEGLARLTPRIARVLTESGEYESAPVDAIRPGVVVAVRPGERVPVDGDVITGQTSLDCSMLTGESAPIEAGPGARVQAGGLNLEQLICITATATAQNSFLAEMTRLVEVAEDSRHGYRLLADKVSAFYSPVVHLGALLTGVGWLAVGSDWHSAVTAAIAVLIITCPCALGLSIPMVHVVAARRLFEAGILVKDGSAIERLAATTRVLFDKTGTITRGLLSASCHSSGSEEAGAIAGALARHSSHPLSRALATSSTTHLGPAPLLSDIEEVPGAGVCGIADMKTYRLGKRSWACPDQPPGQRNVTTEAVLSRDGVEIATYTFQEAYRDAAKEAVIRLSDAGLQVTLISGDRAGPVASAARGLGISQYHASHTPADKVACISALAQRGEKVLMVGDGINDVPALAAAYVSIAPSSAADVGRQAADMVFVRESLEAVPEALTVARRADALVKQNVVFSLLYNAIAIPFAVLGLVTPLAAALAMSTSSLVVVLNALRLVRKSPTARRDHVATVATLGGV